MLQRHDEIIYEPWLAYHRQTGERIKGPLSYTDLVSEKLRAGMPKKGLPQHSRPKFHAMLLEQLDKIGLQVQYGHEIVDYFEDADSKRAGVVMKDGSKRDADLVVAADGIRGASWKLIAGHPVPAKSSGSAIWRVAIPAKLIENDPVITERFTFLEDGTSVSENWLG